MTAKIRQIIEQLKKLVTYKVDKSMSDEDFIANVDAVNFLCDLHDDLRLDRSEIRRNIDKLYPQYSHRVNAKENIQLAMPLIRSLERFIYGRSPVTADLGPAYRRKAFVDMCAKVVAAYRENPLIHSTDYLYALCIVARSRDYVEQREYDEINDILASYSMDIDEVSVEERLRRLMARKNSAEFIRQSNSNWERWTEIRNSLYDVDVRTLDDESYVMWCDLTGQMPIKELKRRSGNSNAMHVEYLHALAMAEFDRISREQSKRRLVSSLKSLNDEIIGDIIPLKIDPDMSVSTLYALEDIFYMRLQLAQVGSEEEEPILNDLCSDRYMKLSKALKTKYTNSESLNEKIEILYHLAGIGHVLSNELIIFAREEAAKLECLSNLTDFQKLFLSSISDVEIKDAPATIARLLPQAKDSFDIAALAIIEDFGSYDDRNAIFTRFTEMFNKALSLKDYSELGKLLALAAYWNINPTMRKKIKHLTSSLTTIACDDISLPERRVNEIAAEVYTQIDKITGKYENRSILQYLL